LYLNERLKSMRQPGGLKTEKKAAQPGNAFSEGLAGPRDAVEGGGLLGKKPNGPSGEKESQEVEIERGGDD